MTISRSRQFEQHTIRASLSPSLAAISVVLILTICSQVELRGQSRPILQLRPDGPLAPIHELQFSDDGEQLYAAGDDKFVQVWRLEEGEFRRSHAQSLRHAIGPGPLGTVRAMSVSKDGRYVVAGGVGTHARHAKYSETGIMVDKSNWSPETLEELGTVTLFDVRNQQAEQIPTHKGYVLAAEIIRIGNQYFLATIGNDEQRNNCMPANINRTLRLASIPDGQLIQEWVLRDTRFQPKLVAWTDPAGPQNVDSLRIAVSLADGGQGDVLAVFRPGAWEAKEIPTHYGWSVDHDAKSNQLCVSSYQSVLVIDPAKESTRTVDLSSQMPNTDGITTVRWISSEESLVAITVKDFAQPASPHRLQIIDLRQTQLMLGNGVPLGNHQNPVLAVDPTGKRLAATADVALGLQIFNIDRPVRRTLAPVQSLKPDFYPVERAALATVDGRRVLRLEVQRGDGLEQIEFVDDGLRKVANNGWTRQDSKVQFDGENGSFIANINGAISETPISIQASSEPLGRSVPWKLRDGRLIAAIGYLRYDAEAQSVLSLFDVSTGQELRRLNGHQQVVSSIAFSEDHRYLVTGSTDGVVCVWSLADLAESFGRRGALLGVTWCDDGNGLIVSRAEESSPLQAGDRLVGLIDENGKPRAYKSAEDLALDLSWKASGSEVRLRTNRSNNLLDVNVPLGQATDERKPLFSFVCRLNPESKELTWLAWTPKGSFQSSGLEIERLAGWHFNPESKGDKAKFAPFEQYRDDFRGDGLVESLLAGGRLPEIWPPHVVAQVGLSFSDANGTPIYEQQGEFRTNKDLRTMQVAVTGVPPQYVEKVEAHFPGQNVPVALSRSSSDPMVWTGDVTDQLAVGESQPVSVTVYSARISDGRQNETCYVTKRPQPQPVVVKPELPEILLQSPSGPIRLRTSDLLPGKKIQIDAIAASAELPVNAEVFAILNGKKATIENLVLGNNRIAGLVPVKVGHNQVAIRVKLGSDSVTSGTVEIEVLDPPSVTSIRGNVQKDNSAQLAMLVASPNAPQPENFRLRIRGVDVDGWKLVHGRDSVDPSRYNVSMSGFTVREGQNLIQLDVLDAQGRRWERQELELRGFTQPKQPKLGDFTFSDDTKFPGPSSRLEFSVVSEDLKTVLCNLRGRSIPVAKGLNLRDGISNYAVDIPLEYGVNRIEITAISEAGLTDSNWVDVERLPRPVELSVTRFVPKTETNPIAVQWEAGDHYVTAVESPVAQGRLEGTVRVSESTAKLLEGSKVIRALVNGFLQSVVRLQDTDNPGELRYSVPVTLSLRDNVIQLELPGLASSEGSLAHVDVACGQPLSDQSLHLLVISTRVTGLQRSEYEKRVHQTLGIKDNRMAAFSEVISGTPVYPAVTGSICHSDSIRSMLMTCRNFLNQKQASNNTVLIYFEGEDLRHADGRFCLMTNDAKPERAFTDPSLITSTYLGEQFDGLKCANLLFLDVTPHVESVNTDYAGDPSQPSLGVLRLVRTNDQVKVFSPFLLSQVQAVLPNVGDLGQLSLELERIVNREQGLAIADSIPLPIRRMRFGELAR